MGVGSHSLLEGIFLTRIKLGSPALQAHLLPSKPQEGPFTDFDIYVIKSANS